MHFSPFIFSLCFSEPRLTHTAPSYRQHATAMCERMSERMIVVQGPAVSANYDDLSISNYIIDGTILRQFK